MVVDVKYFDEVSTSHKGLLTSSAQAPDTMQLSQPVDHPLVDGLAFYGYHEDDDHYCYQDRKTGQFFVLWFADPAQYKHLVGKDQYNNTVWYMDSLGEPLVEIDGVDSLKIDGQKEPLLFSRQTGYPWFADYDPVM